MFETELLRKNLVCAIKGFMTENKATVLPLDFLASGKYGFPSSTKAAQEFIKNGHWDYFFIKGDRLCVHVNYRGNLGLGEYDYEVIEEGVPYYGRTGVVLEKITMINTGDLIKLVQVAYDTLGNVHYGDVEANLAGIAEIDAIEAEYEARRNEVA